MAAQHPPCRSRSASTALTPTSVRRSEDRAAWPAGADTSTGFENDADPQPSHVGVVTGRGCKVPTFMRHTRRRLASYARPRSKLYKLLAPRIILKCRGAHARKLHTVSSANFAPAGPSAAIVAAVCASEILGLAGYSIVPALLPQFIEVWTLTNTQAGWLAGIVSAGYMLAVIPLVSLTDRQPARRIYLASSAASALSCFGVALCDSLLRRLYSGPLPASRLPACTCRACRHSRTVSAGQCGRALRHGIRVRSQLAPRCRSSSAGLEHCWAGAALLFSPELSAPPASSSRRLRCRRRIPELPRNRNRCLMSGQFSAIAMLSS
jgi:hypothetical protein